MGLTKSTARLLREPLVQFLLIGLALFGINWIIDPHQSAGDPAKRIELTIGDLRQATVMWLAQGRPPPTRSELKNMIEKRVAVEILSREAIALGLDKNDEIIRRRLAQKMEFLFEDLGRLANPTTADLEAWLAAHADRFATPPRLSFHHLYFALDKHQGEVRQTAEAALGTLRGEPAQSARLVQIEADPFMFQNAYNDRSPESVSKEFGPAFARDVFRLQPGAWAGPIQSGYGWHLVFVDSIVPGRMPALAEIEPQVKADWVDAQAREVKRKALDEIRSRYTVVVPDLDQATLESLMALAPVAVQGGQ